jgi:hypothetical protein
MDMMDEQLMDEMDLYVEERQAFFRDKIDRTKPIDILLVSSNQSFLDQHNSMILENLPEASMKNILVNGEEEFIQDCLSSNNPLVCVLCDMSRENEGSVLNTWFQKQIFTLNSRIAIFSIFRLDYPCHEKGFFHFCIEVGMILERMLPASDIAFFISTLMYEIWEEDVQTKILFNSNKNDIATMSYSNSHIILPLDYTIYRDSYSHENPYVFLFEKLLI